MAILVAIGENERSKLAIEVAYDLATTYDETLVALHVVPQDDYEDHRDAIRTIPEFRDFTLEQEVDSAAEFAREAVAAAIDDPDLDRVDPQGRVGDVTDEILAAAADIEPRFLAISGRRRSPAGKAIFGNTAQRILLNANCAVVTKLTEE